MLEEFYQALIIRETSLVNIKEKIHSNIMGKDYILFLFKRLIRTKYKTYIHNKSIRVWIKLKKIKQKEMQ